ncbi:MULTISPECIES: toprim domain-containing protein [Bacillus]|uniref:Toprim domain-containing protein n=1 Tax=Bacillus smithii 7_3_47FAA TaxID=665952 RepID=G9QH44_9BACI|nr:toprim domain-containing protein [Bacillus smithii]AKP48324.1 Toprim domain protein [Bacillus smithii]EHL79551.1 hypothetical protein HMPREF1015_01103 [Bacillus smithii 7_3_47FAA]MED0659317.1 toprim domain-containing protein [Bacillus smithii]MED1489759.1 toprim domain-containing protein [Bacillus smithii]MED4882465.1 toprim domain-containing protein [Bacillus smithii]
MNGTDKVIIVEGTSDKRKIQAIIKEPVEIICTNGTIGLSKMDDLVDRLYGRDVYILVDADTAGEKLRKMFKREFPEARHLYVDRAFTEVENTPFRYLAAILLSAGIDIDTKYIEKDDESGI